VLDRDEGRAAEVASALDGAVALGVDVTDRGALDGAAGEVRSRFGRVDAVANVAGIFTPNASAEELPADDFRRAFEVNTLGTLQVAQAFYPLLAESRGAVVNVASQAALVALPMQAAYSASKGAVATLTRCLAIDWADRGIRVNCICPGFTLTPMAAGVMTDVLRRSVEHRVPLGKVFEPVEMANVIVFLASPWASALTGLVLPVDGGWTAGEPALPWE
jgi:meso-butanediol dehydrogenase/(S,S)-butanediol dehydrogenase/diacetyl reductase